MGSIKFLDEELFPEDKLNECHVDFGCIFTSQVHHTLLDIDQLGTAVCGENTQELSANLHHSPRTEVMTQTVQCLARLQHQKRTSLSTHTINCLFLRVCTLSLVVIPSSQAGEAPKLYCLTDNKADPLVFLSSSLYMQSCEPEDVSNMAHSDFKCNGIFTSHVRGGNESSPLRNLHLSCV
jgi:hypothetical protein